MHIIIAILSIATAFFIAYRRFHESGLAIDLNPFLFFRRYTWSKRKQTNPLFILENNADVSAALFFIIAKLDGELTREGKAALLEDYQQLLKMSADEAAATLTQTSFMLENYPIARNDLKKILHKDCVGRFSADESRQVVKHLSVIAEREGAISPNQQQWIADIDKLLAPAQGQLF
ncbi:MAG: hypothetical protein CR974_02355 [Gammaproteobacteria bacterium]|nr:MAG: hypothetical protein CR974_02355 [Gammaproteobacteria bacterium]